MPFHLETTTLSKRALHTSNLSRRNNTEVNDKGGKTGHKNVLGTKDDRTFSKKKDKTWLVNKRQPPLQQNGHF